MVLHTWNQRLDAHAHVHALVPGGGPSLTGDRRWINSRRPDVPHCDGNYLVDSEVLKSEFRKNFLAGLRRLHAGTDQHEGEGRREVAFSLQRASRWCLHPARRTPINVNEATHSALTCIVRSLHDHYPRKRT